MKLKNNIPIPSIDNTWTLFLDRDGVINHEKHQDYIHTWSEFVFYDGVKEAMKIFSEIFRYVIVITNQRGVGRGLTKLEDLHTIHANMREEIEINEGRIDAIIYCTELDDDNPFRKPNTGMGLEAAKQFPQIDFKKTIMVGNTMSDMLFGKNLGAYTVFLPTTRPEVDIYNASIDAVFPSLHHFARVLINKI
ncbi:MAG: HAD-IIIA family hydrolase [Chitinophagaceae bacterium]|nr:MAG: HAD-IIIA family hydrolase [Chitinophagaceae bacterium]